MGKKEKLIQKLIRKPRDFKYAELRSLLGHLGYIENKKGKTSGSRVAFINSKNKHIIRLHKPHPKPVLKPYQLEYIKDELIKRGVIK